jgi:chemotaxis methyl-accepting protein methylase
MQNQYRQPSRISEAIEILRATHDGEDLDPRDLALVQSAVNHNLTEEGIRIFDALHQQAISGTYQKPWLFSIEHLTIDHTGNVRWRDHIVEHYTFFNDDSVARLRVEAIELARRCALLEQHQIIPSTAAVLNDSLFTD